jgi:flagellin
MQRLSSGLRINSAKDDAAGSAISARFTAQIRGNDQAARNANDGISLAQTAEGSLDQIGSNLQRIRELAVQSSNASNSASDRASINNEATQLIAEIDRVASSSSFNGTNLLDGTFTAKSFQVGANNTGNDRITIDAIASAKSNALGVGSSSSYSTVSSGTAVSTGALLEGDLVINGQQVGATVSDGVSTVGANSSGIAKAAAINAVSGKTGVTATVSATAVAGTANGALTAIAAGDITVNGVDIGALAAAGSAAERGAQVAGAINAKTTQTGVTATFDTATGAVALNAADGRNITVSKTAAATGVAANVSGLGSATTSAATTRSTVSLSSSSSAGITLGNGGTGTKTGAAVTTFGAVAAGDISINGVAIGAVTAGTDAATQAANTITAINLKTADTGVTASGDNTGIILTGTGGIALTTKGSASLTSTGFAVGTTNIAGAGATASGLTVGAKAATATAGAGVSSLDLTTAAGAQAALATLDAAINTINTSKGSLGAYQNRFDSTISNLQTTTENLTASRGRITDADFAKETSNLSRAQVLQQAGTAMLAQANQSSQGVLSLLR